LNLGKAWKEKSADGTLNGSASPSKGKRKQGKTVSTIKALSGRGRGSLWTRKNKSRKAGEVIPTHWWLVEEAEAHGLAGGQRTPYHLTRGDSV